MKKSIKKILINILGNQNNLYIKLNCSIIISGILFTIFSIMAQNQHAVQAYNTFSCIAGILLGIWLSIIQYNNSLIDFFKKLFLLLIFFIIFIFSLDFCINWGLKLSGFKFFSGSILSCLGIIACSFYFISKFVDIFIFVKKIFIQIKQKLFNSSQSATSKIKSLIENITAFLVSIAGLGIAIKTIIEPLINLFK